jgi:nucleotide-binding universal stress UspA family protein
MYHTIVVGTDGSASANAAVKAAGEIARRFEVDEVDVVAGYPPVSPAELNQRLRDVPNEFLTALSADGRHGDLVGEATHILAAQGVRVRGHSLPVNGADAILDVADDVGADLIVVGSRGLGVGRRLFLGSVSTKVAHHARCSVMIVQPEHLDESS